MGTTGTTAAARKFGSIEALRFLAALLVVFVHIPGMGFGTFGVDIFFVISGFVMLLSTERSGNNFFAKRLIRILPTYYLFTLGVFAVALVMPGLLNSTTANIEHLIKSLLFIPFDKNGTGHFPVLFLGWTLNYEMYFYALFAIALKFSHDYRAPITALALGFLYVICTQISALPLNAYGDAIVFEFALGMIVYEVAVKKRWKRAALIAGIILAAFTLTAALLSAPLLDDRFFRAGLPSALLVGLAVTYAHDRYIPKPLYTLGGASYALYLTHPYIIQVFDKVTGWFSGGPLLWGAAFAASMILVNIAAVMVFKLMEVPTTTWLRNKLLG